MRENTRFPQQQIPDSKKTEEWKKKCVDWGECRSYLTYSPIRSSVLHKKINSDLVNGILRMSDLKQILKADTYQGSKIPEKIQHYPIMNSKIDLLIGEECSRVWDHRVVVTNPTAVSAMEKAKKQAILARYQEFLNGDQNQTESQDNEELDRIQRYFNYEYQDFREARANFILNHYWKQDNFPNIFCKGLLDAITNAEEIYQVGIFGGEPTIKHLDTKHVHVFRNGYSSRIEDADIIVLEDYWSPGEIYKQYHDVLTDKDREYIEDLPNGAEGKSNMDAVDERIEMARTSFVGEDGIAVNDLEESVHQVFGSDGTTQTEPYDREGNLRVLRVYWKSRRRMKKVKEYDPDVQDFVYNIYPDTHECNSSYGETSEDIWVNEAWEGTKIGEKVYVNMRPLPYQFNSITNPSACHFGIIGQIYQSNDNRPYSMVDKMKPYAYLYDIIHHRLNDLIATSWGTMIRLDMSKKPANMSIPEWMFYARKSKVFIEDSFNEGVGATAGKVAGAMNTNSNGAVTAEQTAGIQNLMGYLQYLSDEMSIVSGVSKQREGSVQNRETVGGVERATMQSAMITKWLFSQHDDVKRRVCEAFLEVCKLAIRGSKRKWENILDDGSLDVMEIDGDEFAENDYGLVVENSDGAQQLSNQIDQIAQAAMQNGQKLSTVMKLFQTKSISEKIRMVEKAEQDIQNQMAQQAQQAAEIEQQKAQAAMETMRMQQEFQDMLNQRDNETKIEVAKIQAGVSVATAEISANAKEAEEKPVEGEDGENLALDVAKLKQDDRHHREDLDEKKREFDQKLSADKQKAAADREIAKKEAEQSKQEHKDDVELKKKQIAKAASKPTAKK